jgi:hypothetical protein
VDQGVHHLQGKTEGVKPSELLALLTDVYRDKLALLRRHVAVARAVAQYDFNNTYQYVIAREEVQLSWLRRAVEGLGGAVPETVPDPTAPAAGESGQAPGIFRDDARLEQEFVSRWGGPAAKVTNARHHGLLRVVLGEALEHRRFFEQAAAGRTDLLGRHPDGVEASGRVLGSRWLE